MGYKLSKHSDVLVSVTFFALCICVHMSLSVYREKKYFFYVINEAFVMRINSNKHEMTSLVPQRNCVIKHTCRKI